MSNFQLVFVFVLAVIFLIIFLKKKRQGRLQTFPYQSAGVLVTPAERSFLGVLDQVLAKEPYRVMAQVRMAEVVTVKKGLQRAEWQRAFNAISRKHVDFVVCRSEDMAIMGVIELDDSSHGKVQRQQRDQAVDSVYKAAGIPMLRVKAAAIYAPNDIKKLLLSELGLSFAGAEATTIIEPDGPDKNAYSKIYKAVDADHHDNIGNPICPKCGSAMLLRVAKKGKYKGQKFWGCSQYPKCKYFAKTSILPSTEE